MQLYHHTLGQPTAQDRYELGKDSPRTAEIVVAVHPKGWALATVQRGDSGAFALHLRDLEGKWRRFSVFGDKHLLAVFGPKDDLYVLSRADAPRGKLLRVTLANPDMAQAKTVVPEGQDTLIDDFYGPSTFAATDTRLLAIYQLGGPSELRAFDLDGTPVTGPTLPPVSSVSGLARGAGDEVFIHHTAFITPPAWYRFDAKTGHTARTGLAVKSPVAFEGVEVVREMATSKDGTLVPVNIIRKKGIKLDGQGAALLYGYGGFSVNLEPRFRASRWALLEQGVTFAMANTRGGGEFGEAWHQGGTRTHKQNVFDDFYAAAKHLVKRGYVAPTRLAIEGGSNGGLLMGAMVTQHPKDFAAVIASVGIYDMLRVELSANGAFNIPEYGTVKDAAQFKALHAYSPYHRVQDGVAYPATLLLTGENDPRVDPMQSRKITARLQAATRDGGPVLLFTSVNEGHGGGTLDARVMRRSDVLAFLFSRLQVDYRSYME